MSVGSARGTRRRFVSAPAGTYPAPAPLDAPTAPRWDDDLFGSGAEPASFVTPLLEPSTSSALSMTEPEPFEEPAPYLATIPGPTASGTLGILVGVTIGALVGIVLSTAMLALYAPTDFAQAIMDPVTLWTETEDWKVLGGTILIAIGFVVLGAGLGAQRRTTGA